MISQLIYLLLIIIDEVIFIFYFYYLLDLFMIFGNKQQGFTKCF